MKTSTPLPAHITRHHAAQDAGQFTPWFKRPAKRQSTLKIYGITLLVDDHLIESCEVTARTSAEAMDRAVDLRLAQAIRERRPNLSIKPWAITGTRLAA